MKKTMLNPEETMNLLTHLIVNNKVLQEQGDVPLALNIEGRAGIGKTAIVGQVCERLNIKKENFVVLNLSQFEEVGDLVGSPIKQYQVAKKNEQGKVTGKWVYEKELDNYIEKGYSVTNSKMSYAEPEWIVGKTEGGVLFLDDYSRASTRFMQATMELINKQEYSSWKLPQGWTIVLSTNPEGGEYSVTDLDAAQKSRYLTVEMMTNKDSWIDWAFKANIDERCIAFVSLNPDVLQPVKNREEVNPRSLHNFFKSIKSIADYNKELITIQILGEAAVGPEITSQFTSFIHNKLDKLPDAKTIFSDKLTAKEVEKLISDVVTKDGYRADIAAVISRRIIQYLLNELVDINEHILSRVEDLIKSDCLGTDLKFVIGQKLVNDSSNRFKRLTTNKEVVDILLE
jgi:hypothetical protein